MNPGWTRANVVADCIGGLDVLAKLPKIRARVRVRRRRRCGCRSKHISCLVAGPVTIVCGPDTSLNMDPSMKSSWHVATAAEAFAAAQFARFGWDVSVQYGANQPEYDLTADDGHHYLKVSVKGSRDGSWGLTQSYLSNANYHGAVDAWLAKHSLRTVFCLVQFKGVPTTDLPRMYLVEPAEIALWLKGAAGGRGDTILYEQHVWTARARAAGTIDRIPEHWRFTGERLNVVASAVSLNRSEIVRGADILRGRSTAADSNE